MRIVFMGTPEFAVESLKKLHESEHTIAGVITMPDKPAGRGYKIQYSPVKEYALKHNLPLLQPEKLKDENFLAQLKSLNADVQVVVAFRMLPEVVWNMPPQGTFNLHASLLPQYRGAAPINWAIINGEKETGVTTFFLTHEIDTGKIILQEKIAISENDNAGTVHDRLMTLGADIVLKTIELIAEGKANATDQSQFFTDDTLLKPAPKIFKETCKIDFEKSPQEIFNFVRGLSPYPAAWTEIRLPEKDELHFLKIYEVSPLEEKHDFKTGKCIIDVRKNLKIACRNGFVTLKWVQAAGKKRMMAEEWLRGMR